MRKSEDADNQGQHQKATDYPAGIAGFVTHSIPEAIKIGSRILLLSPHPGQVRAELNSVAPGADGPTAAALENRIHAMLFAEEVEESTHDE